MKTKPWLVALVVASLVAPASAAVLCQKRKGAVVVREECKKRETVLDLSAFGAVGPQGPEGPQGAAGPQGAEGPQGAPGSAWAWAYVISNGGLHALGGEGSLSVSKPETGVYCVVMPKHYGHKAAQVTLADPGGNKIVSVGTGHGSVCNPFSTETTDVVPVYVRTTAGAAVDGNFTIVIP